MRSGWLIRKTRRGPKRKELMSPCCRAQSVKKSRRRSTNSKRFPYSIRPVGPGGRRRVVGMGVLYFNQSGERQGAQLCRGLSALPFGSRLTMLPRDDRIIGEGARSPEQGDNQARQTDHG